MFSQSNKCDMKNLYHIILLSVLIVALCDTANANNYDDYLARLASDSRVVYDDFLRENPRGQYILDRLNSKEYLSGHPVLNESPDGTPDVDDASWHRFLLDLERARKLASQSPDEGEEFESAFQHTPWYKDQSGDDQLKPTKEITPRRSEVAEQNPIWGEHKVSGGSSEIGQWLDYALLGAGAQDADEDAEGLALSDHGDSDALDPMNQERPFKNDSLPAYCDPPNPCPIGYDPESLPTPCDPTTKYTMELNRDLILSKVASGECTCDTEHMNSCSVGWRGVSRARAYSPLLNSPKHDHVGNPYLQGQRRKRLVAKKSFNPAFSDRYTYMRGQILKKVVKKTGPYAPLPKRNM